MQRRKIARSIEKGDSESLLSKNNKKISFFGHPLTELSIFRGPFVLKFDSLEDSREPTLGLF